MLNAIRIGNFKAFAETQNVPIRPLTLIYGANSSGKSSVIHSLLFARNAYETGELDVHRTNIGGDSVDLGGFRQFIHKRDINLRMGWSAEIDTSAFSGRIAEFLAPVKKLSVSLETGLPQVEEMREQDSIDSRTGENIRIKVPTGKMISAGKPEVMSYSIMADEKLLIRMSKRRDGRLQLDNLDHEHPVFRGIFKAIVETSTTSENIHSTDYYGLHEAISMVVPQIFASVGKFLPDGLLKSEVFTPGTQPQLFPVSRGRRKEDLAVAVQFFVPRILDEIIRATTLNISKELGRLKYLGPLRSYPPRHLAFSQHQDSNWYAGGGYAWDILRRETRVRELVNKWLSAPDRLQTPYELRIRHLLTIDELKGPYHDIIENIADQYIKELDDPTSGTEENPCMDLFGEIYSVLYSIEKSQGTLTDIQELSMVDKRSGTVVSHRDVGIGVSQVLPVLVSAYAFQEQIIAIEQPELHLHPALQADLGDVFIQSALGENKNRFLIETHSEHLLLRIMRRIRETTLNKLPEGAFPVRPEDVMVLFVEPDGSRSVIHEMPLDTRGRLTKEWPGGFFEEGFEEMF